LRREFGADIHARDQEAYTSLHIAQEANVLPLMELLLEHGAATHVFCAKQPIIYQDRLGANRRKSSRN